MLVVQSLSYTIDTNMLDLIAKELKDARPNDEIDFAKDIKSLNPEDKKHYLPPDEARRHIRENKLTADDLRKMIPDSKRSKRDKDWEARRAKDKKRKWDATKLRAVLTCTR